MDHRVYVYNGICSQKQISDADLRSYFLSKVAQLNNMLQITPFLDIFHKTQIELFTT